MSVGAFASRLSAAMLLVAGVVLAPAGTAAHPMGNFSISHYAAIRVLAAGVELRYLVDLAEIPTFQEIQETGIVPEVGHPSVTPYIERKAEALGQGLVLELNGQRLALETGTREILFTPGAGGLPTMKLGMVYRAGLDRAAPSGVNRLRYRDLNFPDRIGWKEVIGAGGSDVVIVESSVPERDRSRQLADYPTDPLNSPPQVLEASLAFTVAPAPPVTARIAGPSRMTVSEPGLARAATPIPPAAEEAVAATASLSPAPAPAVALALEPNRGAVSRDAFRDLVAMPQASAGVFLFAALIAAALGAFHALEPGHGKTVVAAYLVGSRGTARHALLLGLIVTASHTAGVYLLGGVTLYASRYVVPERLYPWLGAVSGVVIAGLGIALFLRHYAAVAHRHHHGHDHERGHNHDHGHGRHHDHPHWTGADEHHGAHHHHHVPGAGPVTPRALLALGVTGGIVPCPAALVVLLSAVALRRVGFGLFLIVAFSVGLAAVLIAIGLLTVYARRAMARFQGEGQLITRWLPLASSAVVTVLGVGIAMQALIAAGILHVRIG